jgi:hypothetical protein
MLIQQLYLGIKTNTEQVLLWSSEDGYFNLADINGDGIDDLTLY